MIYKYQTVHASLLTLMATMFIMASCTSEMNETHYSGKEFVQFSDSLYSMPVTESEDVFEVPVVMSKASDVDRHVIVDVDLKKTNATEGYHFTIENRNLTIPAGEMRANLHIKGNYANLNAKDSLAITLRILNYEYSQLDLYARSANVRLYKIKPFCIDDYVGDMLLTCTFPFSTSQSTTLLTKSEKVNDSTLNVIAPFDDSRNLTLRFHTGKDNPFDRNIDMRTQVAFTDVNYGNVSMSSVEGAPSYYLPEERAFVLYLLAELEHYGAFGAYYYVFEWITPDEALARRNGLPTLY